MNSEWTDEEIAFTCEKECGLLLPTPKAQDGIHPGVSTHKVGQTLHLSAAVMLMSVQHSDRSDNKGNLNKSLHCSHDKGTKQRLILGIALMNNSWFYLVELMSPTLTQSRTISNRFSLVGEKSLVRVNV